MQSPFKAMMDVKRHERPMALLMGTHFFLVITTFWILKPIKKALFIAHYDVAGLQLAGTTFSAARAELFAKVLNVALAFVATVLFAALSNRFRREQLISLFGGLFMAAFALFSVLLVAPGSITVWSFYLLGDLFSTLMVATFFVLLNDIVTPESARRLYGPIGVGGVTGGFVGSSLLRSFIGSVDNPTWMWVCFTLISLMVLTAVLVGRGVRAAATEEPAQSPGPVAITSGNPLLEGARLVLRSRYLMSIVAIVAVYEMVSTIMDFQFSATIARYCDGPEIGEQFATAFAIMNGAALLVQLFMTSMVMCHLGLRVALLVLPFTTLLGSGAFLALPVLWVATLMPTLDVAFAYSINQSAKETLYVPTSPEERYKAKAFIDMFVQRVAKAVAVGMSLLLTGLVTDFSGVRALSLLSIALIAAWVMAARYAGGRFDAHNYAHDDAHNDAHNEQRPAGTSRHPRGVVGLSTGPRRQVAQVERSA